MSDKDVKNYNLNVVIVGFTKELQVLIIIFVWWRKSKPFLFLIGMLPSLIRTEKETMLIGLVRLEHEQILNSPFGWCALMSHAFPFS